MSLKGSEPGEVEPPLPVMEMTDDEKDGNDDKNLSNNSRREKGHTEFASPDTNNSGGDTDILSQTTDDSSESELESGQLVLKKSRTAKKQNISKNKKHKKVSLHSSVSKHDQEVLACGNSSESDLECSQSVLKKPKAAKQNNTEMKEKEALRHPSVSKPDQEVSAINLSNKSARVLILSYSGERAIEDISRDYLYQIIKDLGGKVSLAKSLNTDALFKAVAVKLVNHNSVNIKNGASLSNLKRSDIAMIKR